MPPVYLPFMYGMLRVVVYSAITALLFFIAYINAITTGTFGETSVVEIAQSIILLVIIAIFANCALKISALSNSAWLLATFATASLIRENDVWLDMLFDGGWQILVMLVVSAGLIQAYRNREELFAEQQIYTESTSFGLLAGALITTYVFSRLFGMGRFWQTVMQDAYMRPVKDVSEECVELFGYGLLLCAAIEFFVLARRIEGACFNSMRMKLPSTMFHIKPQHSTQNSNNAS